MATYRLVSAAINGAERDEVPWTSLTFTDLYNGAGPIGFEVSKHSPKCTQALLLPAETELHVYRDDVFIWGGYLWSAHGSGDSSLISFAGASYFSRFEHRYISDDQVLTAVEQLDGAWGLIDYSQGKAGGGLGITQASVPASGVLRTVTYLAQDRPVISDAIATLAGGEDGFDYAIVPRRDDAGVIYREWFGYYPQKGQQRAAVVELPKNVSGYTYDLDGEPTTSERTAIGSGSGASALLAVSSDAGALATFGLLEASESFPDVEDQMLLQEHADEDEANHVSPLETITVTIEPQDVDAGFDLFDTGDTIRVRITDGYYVATDDYRRVASKTISVNSKGKETFTVALDLKAA